MTAEQPSIFGELAHPAWCDANRCTAQPPPSTAGLHYSAEYRIPENTGVPGLWVEHPPWRVVPRGDQPSRDGVLVHLLESPVFPGVPYVGVHMSWSWTPTGVSLANAKRMAEAILELCKIADEDLSARREERT